MEASTLSHAARRGLLTRKAPLLKLKGDEQLIALVRSGNAGAFDIIVDRYQARLLGFCRQMIGSTEDAEDVTVLRKARAKDAASVPRYPTISAEVSSAL